MTEGLVTAIITTHNRLNFLKRAVQSVKEQTYQNIEIIVVDDGSTDGTEEYCREAGVEWAFIPPSEHKNGNYARNLGVKKANGEYLAFLDDDDEWLPTKIEKQVAALMRNDRAGVVYVGRVFNINDGRLIYNEEINTKMSGDLSREVFYNIVSTTSCLMIRRMAFEEVGGFDEDLAFWQETELMIRLCQKFEVACILEPLVLYRINYATKFRLSNKIDGFMEAVSYINKKHAKEIARLTDVEKKKRQVMIDNDIANRYSIMGDNKKARKFLKKAFVEDKTVKNFLKWLLCYTIYRRDARRMKEGKR